jgi:hypothetical protein
LDVTPFWPSVQPDLRPCSNPALGPTNDKAGVLDDAAAIQDHRVVLRFKRSSRLIQVTLGLVPWYARFQLQNTPPTIDCPARLVITGYLQINDRGFKSGFRDLALAAAAIPPAPTPTMTIS